MTTYSRREAIALVACAAAGLFCGPAVAGDEVSLESRLRRIASSVDGRMGISVRRGAWRGSVDGGAHYPLQSVMKLVMAAAVFDAVDRRGWKLDEKIRIHREDLSVHVQPIAGKVIAAGQAGYEASVDELLMGAVAESDSAATDVLLRKLGGPAAVNRFLSEKRLGGMRVDRDERHLQSEIAGLEWRAEFVDPAKFDRAVEGVPDSKRREAFEAALRDPRDTATPDGMAEFLHALNSGELLSAPATARLLEMMSLTSTFPDRLKAGLPGGWNLRHKTGTGPSRNGVVQALNDVGIIVPPVGEPVVAVVFISGARTPAKECARSIARVSAECAAQT